MLYYFFCCLVWDGRCGGCLDGLCDGVNNGDDFYYGVKLMILCEFVGFVNGFVLFLGILILW